MSAYIPVALQRQVRDFFQNRCAYCQTAEWLTTSTFEYEHIVPISAGGGTLFANLCLAALRMNRAQLLQIRRMWVTMHEHPPR